MNCRSGTVLNRGFSGMRVPQWLHAWVMRLRYRQREHSQTSTYVTDFLGAGLLFIIREERPWYSLCARPVQNASANAAAMLPEISCSHVISRPLTLWCKKGGPLLPSTGSNHISPAFVPGDRTLR